jgi:hypothetical protein
MKKLALLAALAALGLVGNAQAATVTYNDVLPESTTDIHQDLSLPLFDTVGGTLTLDSVELILTGRMTSTITLTNNAAQAQTVHATGSVDLSFTSNPASIATLLGWVNPAIHLQVLTGNQTINPGGTVSVGPLTNNGQWDSGILTSAGVLALFSDAGNPFGLHCDSDSGISVIGGGGNVTATQSTTAGCDAHVTYVYHDTPTNHVPEPATLGLLGLGLLGLGMSRRRKAA